MIRKSNLVVRRPEEGRRSNGSYSGGPISLGVLPAVLLHGSGAAGFDEIAIFGGIGLIVLGLIFMSWRAGRKRKHANANRRRRR